MLKDMILSILSADPGIRVVGTAGNGNEAIEMTALKKPDVITMDVNMPGLNGLEATRRIMETTPTPIIILSANFHPRDVNDTFKALQAGAVAICEKPHSAGSPQFPALAAKLVQSVKLMSEIKVIKRISRYHKPEKLQQAVAPISGGLCAVAIGTSTGGPIVVEKILAGLNKDFPLPVLLVQHITSGFVSGYIEWLSGGSAIPVKLAEEGEQLRAGVCYVAPDDTHLTATPEKTVHLMNSDPEFSSKPAVSVMFRSLRYSFGKNVCAVLLTGMGKDGAEELKALHDTGALTIAQDKESSTVFGMPGEAIRLGGAGMILNPDKIIDVLNGLKVQ